MSRAITALISLKMQSFIYEWVNKFEVEVAHRRYPVLDIKLIFRNFSKDDPQNIIFIEEALRGNIQKSLQSNNECLKSQKVDLVTIGELK